MSWAKLTHLVGYEKTYWDKIQREEAEARASLLAGGPGDDTEPPADIPSPELPDPSTDTIKIKLRGSAGEVAVSTKQVNSAVTLVRYYCSKFGLTYEGSGLCLILDGERVENNTTVEEMDLDDGDMVDVDTR
jgi:hypothetical protein